MLEQINSCLEFTLQATAISPHSLLTNARNITLNQNLQSQTIINSFNLHIQNDFSGSENQPSNCNFIQVSESFVINEVEQTYKNFICEISEKNEEEEDSKIIQKNQQQKQMKTLKEQIMEKIQNKQKKQQDEPTQINILIPQRNSLPNTKSKSPLNRKNELTPNKSNKSAEKENQMPTIHKKQFSQIQDQKSTSKKEYLPFQNVRYTITPSRQSNVEKKSKLNTQAFQQQRHSFKQEYKNGISHIKLNLYKL